MSALSRIKRRIGEATTFAGDRLGDVRGGYERVTDASDDIGRRLDAWATAKAPGLRTVARAAENLSYLSPGTPSTLANRLTRQRPEDMRGNRLLEDVVQPFHDVQRIGNRLVAD